MRSTRLVPLLLVLALMAASCGGDGSVFGTSSTAPTTPIEDLVDAEALVAAEVIVGDLGPEPGMLAVGYALDRGYTAGQIAAAARSHTLQAHGTITGVEPALPLWGVFSDLPEATGATGGGNPAGFALGRRADDPDEPNPYELRITKDQWVAGLQAEADLVFSGPAAPPAPSSGGSPATSAERATIMIGLIIDLSDLGYSAEQIILGIALGEVRLAAVPTGQGPIGCWLLQDSAGGGVIRPALPALPGALRGTGECRRAIDRLAPSDTSSTSITTTTAAAVDADGIPDGLYTGIVQVTGEVTAPVYEILAGEIRLAVTDESVQAEVEYTLRVSVRSSFDEATCVATIDYLYAGESAALTTLGFPLQPVTQSIRLLEGPECGIVDPWDTTAEDYLLAGFAEERTITLGGWFAGGTFTGQIGGTPLGVSASTGD